VTFSWTEFRSAPAPCSSDAERYGKHIRFVVASRSALGAIAWHFKYTVDQGLWTDCLRVNLPTGPAIEVLTHVLNRNASEAGLVAIVPRAWDPVPAFLATNAALTVEQINRLLVLWQLWCDGIISIARDSTNSGRPLESTRAACWSDCRNYFETGNIDVFASSVGAMGWDRHLALSFGVLAKDAGLFSIESIRQAGMHVLANTLNEGYWPQRTGTS